MNRKLAAAAVAGTGLILALGSASALGAPGSSTYEQCMQKAGLTPQTSGVQVCKLVIVTKLFTWNWTLQKTASPGPLQIAPGGSGSVDYTITATPTQTVSWYVSGAVIVKNFTGADANNVTATDTFTVPGTAPQTTVLATGQRVQPGKERHFDYGIVTPDAVAGTTNTGSATWTGGDGSVTVPIDFANPPNRSPTTARSCWRTPSARWTAPGSPSARRATPGPGRSRRRPGDPDPHVQRPGHQPVPGRRPDGHDRQHGHRRLDHPSSPRSSRSTTPRSRTSRWPWASTRRPQASVPVTAPTPPPVPVTPATPASPPPSRWSAARASRRRARRSAPGRCSA